MTQHIVRYLSTAQQDLLDIFDYVQRDNPDAAAALVDEIDRALGQLATHPKLGIVPRDTRLARMGYRMLVVGRYLAFYVVDGDTVQIRRVLHGSRRYRFLL